MKRIIKSNQPKKSAIVADEDIVMKQQEWDRKWDEKFGDMDKRTYSPAEFHKLMEEAMNFEEYPD